MNRWTAPPEALGILVTAMAARTDAGSTAAEDGLRRRPFGPKSDNVMHCLDGLVITRTLVHCFKMNELACTALIQNGDKDVH